MQDETLKAAAEEISFRDIVNFFKENGKRVVIGGVVGLLISSVYVIQAPRAYMATWQMQMAQFSKKNIEEPGAMIERLKSSTAYSVEALQLCGMSNDEEIGDYLNNKLEAKPINNLPKSVQFKVRANSSEQAKQCAEAIAAMTIADQHRLVEESLAGSREQLVQYQLALAEEWRQLDKMNKSELVNFGYLVKIEKLSWLRTRIDAVQEEILLSQMYPAKVTVPVYGSNKPVSPKVKLVLMLGILIGLILGVSYSLGREVWRRFASVS